MDNSNKKLPISGCCDSCSPLKNNNELAHSKPASSRVDFFNSKKKAKTRLFIKEISSEDDIDIIEKSLKKHEGISSVDSDWITKEIIITHDLNYNEESLINILMNSGFTPTSQTPPSLLDVKYFYWDLKAILILISTFFVLLYLVASYFYQEPSLSYLLFVAIILSSKDLFIQFIKNIRLLNINMYILMAIAVIGACILGDYLEAAVVSILFSVSQIVESASLGRVRRTIFKLMKEQPKYAWVKRSNDWHHVNIEEVIKGETVKVKPGNAIPLDGKITWGSATINQSALTGESTPIFKSVGENVLAGSFAIDGQLEMVVNRVFDETAFAKIIKSIESIEYSRANIHKTIDNFAKIYTPIVIILALAVFLMIPLLFDGDFALWGYRSLSLLVMACPCALIIATPVSIVSGLTLAARYGIIIKGGLYLEAIGKLSAIAFDKTGTLTTGRITLKELVILRGNESDIISDTISIFSGSDHHLSNAIVKSILEKSDAKEDVNSYVSNKPTDWQYNIGLGISATVNGRKIWAGKPSWVEEQSGFNFSSECKELSESEFGTPNFPITTVAISDGKERSALFLLDDPLRSESEALTSLLQHQGVHLSILTGDNTFVANKIATLLGIKDVHANLLPHEKVEKITELKKQYEYVAMVGDGINDTPSFKASSVGIAVGSSDIAIETSDVVIVGSDINKISTLVNIGRMTLANVKENIFLAMLFKTTFIILSIMGYSSLWMAVMADSGVSILVLFNALRLIYNAPSRYELLSVS